MKTRLCPLAALGAVLLTGALCHRIILAAQPDDPSAAQPPLIVRSYDFYCASEVLAAADMYLPDQLMAYRVLRRAPTRSDALALAAKLGVTLPPATRANLPTSANACEGKEYWAQLGDWHITLDNAFGYLLTNDATGPSLAGHPPAHVTDAVALDGAAVFLSRTGLLPTNCHLVGVAVQYAVSHTPPGSDRGADVVVGRSVSYERYLDGRPAGGIHVAVNPAGQAYTAKSSVRRLTPVGRVPVLSPAQAFAALVAGEARITATWHPHRTYLVEIDSITIVYPEHAAAHQCTDYLEPIYLLDGKMTDQKSGYLLTDRFHASLPAIAPKYRRAASL